MLGCRAGFELSPCAPTSPTHLSPLLSPRAPGGPGVCRHLPPSLDPQIKGFGWFCLQGNPGLPSLAQDHISHVIETRGGGRSPSSGAQTPREARAWSPRQPVLSGCSTQCPPSPWSCPFSPTPDACGSFLSCPCQRGPGAGALLPRHVWTPCIPSWPRLRIGRGLPCGDGSPGWLHT